MVIQGPRLLLSCDSPLFWCYTALKNGKVKVRKTHWERISYMVQPRCKGVGGWKSNFLSIYLLTYLCMVYVSHPHSSIEPCAISQCFDQQMSHICDGGPPKDHNEARKFLVPTDVLVQSITHMFGVRLI
jgi:hypothetical protein